MRKKATNSQLYGDRLTNLIGLCTWEDRSPQLGADDVQSQNTTSVHTTSYLDNNNNKLI